jgi:hypothetical protein
MCTEASVIIQAAQIEKISACYQRQQFSFQYMRGIPHDPAPISELYLGSLIYHASLAVTVMYNMYYVQHTFLFLGTNTVHNQRDGHP